MEWNIFIDKHIHQSHNCFIRNLSLPIFIFQWIFTSLVQNRICWQCFFFAVVKHTFILCWMTGWYWYLFWLGFCISKCHTTCGLQKQKCMSIFVFIIQGSIKLYLGKLSIPINLYSPIRRKMIHINIQHCQNTSKIQSNNVRKRQTHVYMTAHVSVLVRLKWFYGPPPPT